MSVSPAQNFSKPPPVPLVPTETSTSGSCSLNSSPAAAVSGWTVDEPSTRTSPEMPSPLPPVALSESESGFWPPQPASTRVLPSAAAASAANRFWFTFVVLRIPFLCAVASDARAAR